MTALRAIEEWTCQRQPPDPMKATFFILLAIAISFFALGLSSCADLRLTGLSVDTPYGTVTSDNEGNTTISIRPVIIHEK